MEHLREKKSAWRRPAAIPALALSIALLSGCAAQVVPGSAGGEPEKPPIQVLGLTAEQKREDYEYFWSTLRDSYPCWGILEREGLDVEAIYQDYTDLAESEDDIKFYSAIYSALWRLGRNGHLWVIEPEAYDEMMALPAAERPADRRSWYALLDDPDTAAGYARLAALLAEAGGEGAQWDGAEPGENLSTLLLPGEKTAYLRIGSFAGDEAADKPVIDAFYGQLAGYDDLILDVTGNSGGSELYWQNLVVAPLLDAPLECVNYALTRRSENNALFLDEVFAPGELRPIGELPELPKLQEADRALATHFVESTLHVDPAPVRAPFHGRVWVLVGPNVYSASESFSVFCQQTGFAALVGEQTGGDGIGALDPIMMQLPNSRILVQFTAMFGLNPDGSSNEEAGTAPDVPSRDGEPPLAAALRAIQTARQKG